MGDDGMGDDGMGDDGWVMMEWVMVEWVMMEWYRGCGIVNRVGLGLIIIFAMVAAFANAALF